METPVLNFERFQLPFLMESRDLIGQDTANDANDEEDDEDDEEEEDADLVKENMEDKIPNTAIFLGQVETEVRNWTSWTIQDDYYILPLHDDEFDWALFRISWDDNWGRWDWSPDGRIKGCVNNYKEAAKFILTELWSKWEIDLNKSENKEYAKILERI